MNVKFKDFYVLNWQWIYLLNIHYAIEKIHENVLFLAYPK